VLNLAGLNFWRQFRTRLSSTLSGGRMPLGWLVLFGDRMLNMGLMAFTRNGSSTHGSKHIAEMASPVSHEPSVSTNFTLKRTHLQKTKYGFKKVNSQIGHVHSLKAILAKQ